MPFTFLSHQAAVVPLKMAAPRRLCGTALAIGSMAPDLEYFLRLQPVRTISHAFVGQLVFCLPVTLFLVWLVTRLIARPLAFHLPDAGPFHLRDYRVLARKRLTRAFWVTAAVSALIGSFSHIVWDSFTHGYGWSVRRLPALRREVPLGRSREPIHRFLQHGSTLAGAAVTVGLLAAIGRRRLVLRWAGSPTEEDEPQPTRESRRSLWLPVLLGPLAGGLAGVARVLDWSRLPAGVHVLSPRGDPALLVMAASVFFGTITFSFLGLCLGCVLADRRMKRADSRRTLE